MNLTKEEIIMLAEMEHCMDVGAQPFVRLEGERLAVSRECMDEFHFAQGQTITRTIFGEILRWNIANLQLKINEEKLSVTKEEQAP